MQCNSIVESKYQRADFSNRYGLKISNGHFDVQMICMLIPLLPDIYTRIIREEINQHDVIDLIV